MSTMIAVPACTPSELLSYVLRYQASSTVIVCQSREAFLSSLLLAVSTTLPVLQSSSSSQASETEATVPDHPTSNTTAIPHHLLLQTLDQISKARHINMVFVPSIAHLRAYLAVLQPKSSIKPTESGKPSSDCRESFLIYGLVDIHRDTSEWSVQGLAAVVAAAAEAAHRLKTSVFLIEELNALNEWNDDQKAEELVDSEAQRESVWQQKLPMLNGSLRRQFSADDPEVERWIGRTVEVGSVLSRWCEFVETDFWTKHTVS